MQGAGEEAEDKDQGEDQFVREFTLVLCDANRWFVENPRCAQLIAEFSAYDFSLEKRYRLIIRNPSDTAPVALTVRNESRDDYAEIIAAPVHENLKSQVLRFVFPDGYRFPYWVNIIHSHSAKAWHGHYAQYFDGNRIIQHQGHTITQHNVVYKFEDAGDGQFRIKTSNDQLYVTADLSSKRGGITMCNPDSQKAQLFSLEEASIAPEFCPFSPKKRYRIIVHNLRDKVPLALTVRDESKECYAEVIAAPVNESCGSQVVRILVPDAENYPNWVNIVHLHSDKTWHGHYAEYFDGNRIIHHRGHTTTQHNVIYKFEDAGNGQFRIKTSHDELYVTADVTKETGCITMCALDAQKAQLFSLEEVVPVADFCPFSLDKKYRIMVHNPDDTVPLALTIRNESKEDYAEIFAAPADESFGSQVVRIVIPDEFNYPYWVNIIHLHSDKTWHGHYAEYFDGNRIIHHRGHTSTQHNVIYMFEDAGNGLFRIRTSSGSC
eukprot:TRINITY_DN15923_c0_g1_i1.p1 TRINITY_DN15923_c0_g1~~TRINITY_DN15923_c0_g1_i1.p1  ORF type:complete len:492 (-),score=92.66 TRINITY_DN15923_c0_g1_i1:681-2156(-)